MSNIGFRIFPPNRAPKELVEPFRDVPSPNVSDNMSRINGVCAEIRPMHGLKQLLGSAFTVKTRPGDNLMVHKALDMLQPGDALVIDAGGDTTNAILGEINVPVTVGGAIVNPGDVVVGDADGVVVVPLDDAEYVAGEAKKVVEKEAVTMREIEEGTLDRSWVDEALKQRGCQWIGF